jgi:hypothetical protein
MNTIILTPIAERDVHFYLAIAKQLKERSGSPIVFVSFYQPGNQMIRDSGFEVFDPYQAQKLSSFPLLSPSEIEKKFSTPPLKDLMLHEYLTFGISDREIIFKKFSDYFQAIDQILAEIEEKYSNGIIIQELAGFVGPLSVFYAGMKRGWNHQFLEPSFFKGRIHFLKDNLFLNIPASEPSIATAQTVTQYLDQAAKGKVVVAASKDAHHYMDMGYKKVFNLTNLTKISKKLYAKYVRQEKQEFEHIFNHSLRYLKMLKNRLKNEKKYSHLIDLPADKLFIYFPFHVQLDFSLTIRCPHRLDQLGLLEEMISNLPSNMVLLCKEHPASIGCLDQPRLENLFTNPQFKLLHPQHNSYDILEKVAGVITINSKVGAEGISLGLPVISFGSAFYTKKPYCLPFENWSQFQAEVKNWTLGKRNQTNPAWIQFLSQVWEDSVAVELYDQKPNNISNFVEALAKLAKLS